MAVKKRPALQGELDGACGFYAIANGIHLLEPELTLPEIFPIILQQYVFDGDPMGFVNGIARGSLKNTLSRTMALLNAEYEFYDPKTREQWQFTFSMPYWHNDKPRDRRDILDTLSLANHKEGRVIIQAYDYNDGEQEYSHWTVISKVTDEGLATWDSSKEVKCIPFDKIRVDSIQHSNIARPWNIRSADTFVLSRQPL
ncbi:MAG: hypothetical protein KH310_03385 [Enterobacteriaceae bacterium]|nr:hypothetical protein [Enterobacteriaceae bacterium]